MVAIISAANFYFSRRDKSVDLRVVLETHLTRSGADVSPPFFAVCAKNFGDKQVHLCAAEIILPDKKQIVLSTGFIYPDTFPAVLGHGDSFKVAIPYSTLAATLKQNKYASGVAIRGRFRDELGRQFLSKKIKWKYTEWLKG